MGTLDQDPKISVSNIRDLVERLESSESLIDLPEFIEWLDEGIRNKIDDSDVYQAARMLFDGGIKEAIIEFISENPDHPRVLEILQSFAPMGSQEGEEI
jgi:hypothetical protein